MKFGELFIIGKSKIKRSNWEARCDCGKIIQVYTSNLTQGRTTSCGCNRVKKSRILLNQLFDDHKKVYTPGCRVDKLLILESYPKYKNGKLYKHWKVKCDCGNVVTRSKAYLRDTRTPIKSCGCTNKTYKRQPMGNTDV